MIVRFGKSAASSSIADGCAWRIFAPMPPGIPAPIPVVPTSIITGTFERVDHLEERVERGDR